MSEKSYVSMGLCPICNKENGEILMDMRLKDSMERFTPTPDPCDKCRKEYLTKGVLMMERTGRLMVLKDDAFKRLFNKPVPKEKVCFVEEGLLDKIEIR